MKDGYFVVIRHADGYAYVVLDLDDDEEGMMIWDTEELAEEWCRENPQIQSGQVEYGVYPLP